MSKARSRYREKNPVQTRFELDPQTEAQKSLVASINFNDQTFVFGPAGTGKTYVATMMAAAMLDDGTVERIVLSRPNVPSGPTLGFFSGTLEEKMAPWAVPIMEVLNEALGASHVQNLTKSGKVEVVPFGTMRGRTFNNSFVILDEAQNVSPQEMKMFLTRMGHDTKVVVNGDISQSDLGHGVPSGLSVALTMAAQSPELSARIGIVEFDVDDVVRSGITGLWVRAFWESEKKV